MPGQESTVAKYAPENTIFFVSISKAIAPGLRFAAISCPERYLSSIDEALYGLNVSISPFMEELSCRLLVSDRADRIIKKHRKSMIQRNKLVNRIIGQYVFGGDENSIFRWIKLPQTVDECTFERMAYRQGVSVCSSERFAVGNTKPFGAVRIALGAPRDLQELENGLEIIKDLLIKLS
jgi:DNA-binding transcriptional MocR family regulator